MVDFAPYAPNMQHDFELYSTQEQHLEFMATTQSYIPSTSYHMDPVFTSAYEPVTMPALSEAPRPQDLQSYYDGIAQGVKPSYQQFSPTGSPNSGSHSFDNQPPVLSASSESGASVSSSTIGSPSLNPQYHEPWNPMVNGLGLQASANFAYDGLISDKCVDPNLIHPPYVNPMQYPHSPQFASYPAEIRATPSPYGCPIIEQAPSPAPSHTSVRSQRPGSNHIKRGSSQSPYLRTQSYQPYSNFSGARRQSDASLHSQNSGTSRKSGSSFELTDENHEKGQCPLPECGRVFKDLKAHMLTHQNERPEKCPIATCEYHMKGFARKYDKNRHTLTHYKGTMVWLLPRIRFSG